MMKNNLNQPKIPNSHKKKVDDRNKKSALEHPDWHQRAHNRYYETHRDIALARARKHYRDFKPRHLARIRVWNKIYSQTPRGKIVKQLSRVKHQFAHRLALNSSVKLG